MDTGIAIALLFALGLLLLVMEIFLPSHGILTLGALASLGYGVYLMFQISATAGFISIASVVVVIPTMLLIAVKNWHRTPIGRRISPPNPQLTEEDRLPIENLQRVVGTTGRTATPLRPVGICVFDGQRVESISESGMIAANVPVEAVRLVDRTVVVRPIETQGQNPA